MDCPLTSGATLLGGKMHSQWRKHETFAGEISGSLQGKRDALSHAACVFIEALKEPDLLAKLVKRFKFLPTTFVSGSTLTGEWANGSGAKLQKEACRKSVCGQSLQTVER